MKNIDNVDRITASRIRKLLEKYYLSDSQKALKKHDQKMIEAFISDYARIERFSNITVKSWLSGARTPSKGTLIDLVDFFNKKGAGITVGYLLGEIANKNYDIEFICKYLGLNHEAVESIRHLANIDASSSSFSNIDDADEYNSVLSAEEDLCNINSSILNLLLSSNKLSIVLSNILTVIDANHEYEITVQADSEAKKNNQGLKKNMYMFAVPETERTLLGAKYQLSRSLDDWAEDCYSKINEINDLL